MAFLRLLQIHVKTYIDYCKNEDTYKFHQDQRTVEEKMRKTHLTQIEILTWVGNVRNRNQG